MAKVKLGAIVTEISGKLGGQYFATHPSGTIMANKPVKSANSNFNFNQKQQNFAIASHTWGQLSAAYQQSWQNFALTLQNVPTNASVVNTSSWRMSAGAQIKNARQLFIQYNTIRLNVGAPILLLCPSAPLILSLPAFSVSLPSLEVQINFDEPIDSDNIGFYIGFSKPVNQSVNNPGKSFSQVDWFLGGDYQVIIGESQMKKYPNFFNTVGYAFMNVVAFSYNSPQYYRVLNNYKFQIPN